MKLKGFTLIEVLTVLIISGLLALIVATSSSFMLQKNEDQIIVDEIRAAIQYAKIQAISLGHPVTLIPFDEELNWSKGMVLVQQNSEKNNTNILYQWQWHHPRWYIKWAGINSPNKITFSDNPITAISNGTFVLFNTNTKERKVIILNRLGRIKTASHRENGLILDPSRDR